jgi:hypothetical protein
MPTYKRIYMYALALFNHQHTKAAMTYKACPVTADAVGATPSPSSDPDAALAILTGTVAVLTQSQARSKYFDVTYGTPLTVVAMAAVACTTWSGTFDVRIQSHLLS